MTNAPKPSESSPDNKKIQPTTDESSTSRQTFPTAWVERIFSRLACFYGTKFADLWRGCDLKTVQKTWAEALRDYDSAEIKTGLTACMTRVFPPTLPEFLMLCRPPIDYEFAFYEACNQMAKRENNTDKWHQPALFWAAVNLGFDMKSSTYQSIKARWKTALNEAIEGLKTGRLSAEIPKRFPALTESKKISVPPEIAKQRIKEITAMLKNKKQFSQARYAK